MLLGISSVVLHYFVLFHLVESLMNAAAEEVSGAASRGLAAPALEDPGKPSCSHSPERS